MCPPLLSETFPRSKIRCYLYRFGLCLIGLLGLQKSVESGNDAIVKSADSWHIYPDRVW